MIEDKSVESSQGGFLTCWARQEVLKSVVKEMGRVSPPTGRTLWGVLENHSGNGPAEWPGLLDPPPMSRNIVLG